MTPSSCGALNLELFRCSNLLYYSFICLSPMQAYVLYDEKPLLFLLFGTEPGKLASSRRM